MNEENKGLIEEDNIYNESDAESEPESEPEPENETFNELCERQERERIRNSKNFYRQQTVEARKEHPEDKTIDGRTTAESYNRIKGRGRQFSYVFRPGERVEGTLLTVVGPGYKNRYGQMTWKEVLCRCDCGNEIKVPYPYLYQKPSKYSCGCKRRKERRASDYIRDKMIVPVPSDRDALIEFAGMAASHENGRTITVLYRNADYLKSINYRDLERSWVCVTGCCGETFEVRVTLKSRFTLLCALYNHASKRCDKCGAGGVGGA